MEGLMLAKSKLSTYLHPSMTDNVEQGVLNLLNSLLLKYNEELDGAVLSYFDLKVCDSTPKLLPGLSPYLSLKVKAKFLLFSPKPGMYLEGTVNKVKEDFIGVVVLGIYNVVIGHADIRDEFFYQTDENEENLCWKSNLHRHVIKIGSRIKFTVKSVQIKTFLDIVGSLIPSDTGCVKWLLSKQNQETSGLQRKNIKKENKEITNETKKRKRT